MPSTEITDEVVTFTAPKVGRIAAVLPVIPDGAPERVREGIARRRLTVIEGTCPCGAAVDYAAACAGDTQVAEAAHARLCPASTDALVVEVRRWRRQVRRGGGRR